MFCRTLAAFALVFGAGCRHQAHPSPEPVVDPPGPSVPVLVAPTDSQTTREAVDEGPICGSRGNAPCPAGSFCSFPTTAHCGETDAPGRCLTKPGICTKIFAPVCGCDGKQYGNECAAANAGTSVASAGSCPR